MRAPPVIAIGLRNFRIVMPRHTMASVMREASLKCNQRYCESFRRRRWTTKLIVQAQTICSNQCRQKHDLCSLLVCAHSPINHVLGIRLALAVVNQHLVVVQPTDTSAVAALEDVRAVERRHDSTVLYWTAGCTFGVDG